MKIIQVSKETKERLESLKAEPSETYDNIIKHLLDLKDLEEGYRRTAKDCLTLKEDFKVVDGEGLPEW